MVETIEYNITKALGEWLVRHGFGEVAVCGLDNCFFYDTDDNAIGYTIIDSEKNICSWNKFFIEELDCPVEIDSFYSSFLHELGHAMTWDFLSEEEQDQPTIGMSNEEYFYIPKEIVASKWAIDFIRNNLSAVEDLVHSLDKVFAELENFIVDMN